MTINQETNLPDLRHRERLTGSGRPHRGARGLVMLHLAARSFQPRCEWGVDRQLHATRHPSASSLSRRRYVWSTTAIGSSIDPRSVRALTARFARARCRTGSSRPGSFSQRSLSLPRSDSICLHPCSSTYERSIPMTRLLMSAAVAISILASSTALAAERTVTLAVKNMYCAETAR